MRIGRATVTRCLAAVLLIAAVGALGLILTYWVANGRKSSCYEERELQAATAAAAIDSDEVQALTGTERDTASPAWRDLRSRLVRIKQSDPRVRFVYLMRPAGGKLVFLVDSEDPSSPDYSRPGQVYQETKPFDLEVFQGKRKAGAIAEGPVTDEWGTWLSASAYVNDSAGRPIALLGTDVDFADAVESYNQARLLGVLFSIVAMLFLGFVAFEWIVRRRNQEDMIALRAEVEESAARVNEELLKADRAKSEFIQLASHELRSPVNALNVAVQTLGRCAKDRLRDDEKTLLEIASGGGNRLAALVDNLLDATRIESGDFGIEPVELDASDLVTRTARLFEPMALEKKIGITLMVPDGGAVAVVDPHAILRVLENLLSNAIKFTDFGGIVIELNVTSEKLRFSIRDTGTGIPEFFKDEVFERFAQLERPSGTGTRGAGMGLALCKSIIEAQGGRIWFESVEDKGSTFYFEVPRYQHKPEKDGGP